MDEKMDEKELSKHEEKASEEKYYGEKDYDEKNRRDPLGNIIFAAILIWGGLVFLGNNLGFLEKIGPISRYLPIPEDPIGIYVPFVSSEAIQFFLVGLIGILIIEIIIRLTIPQYRRPVFGTIIGIGLLLSWMFNNWDLILPLVFIAIGLSILTRDFWRKLGS